MGPSKGTGSIGFWAQFAFGQISASFIAVHEDQGLFLIIVPAKILCNTGSFKYAFKGITG